MNASSCSRGAFPRAASSECRSGSRSPSSAGTIRESPRPGRAGASAHRTFAVYVGGFFSNKRIDRLIDAIAATRGDWALVAIGRDLPGGANDAAICAARAAKAGIEYRAPGPLPREQVVRSIRAADAVVLGSSYEGFGVTLAEAIAAAVPFVSFRVGAAPEMAATGAGEVVDSVEEFTNALGRLSDPSVRAQRIARARAVAPDWSDDAMLDRYLSAYERLAVAAPLSGTTRSAGRASARGRAGPSRWPA